MTLLADSRAFTRTLKLSNTIWNRGAGLFELYGQVDSEPSVLQVVQRIYSTDGSVEQRPVRGQFIYHEGHEHWHFSNFSIYELFTLRPDGRMGERVATSDKASYCIRSNTRDSSYPVRTENVASNSCGPGVQAIASGWGDTYKSDLPEQKIDVTDVPDGLYVLRSTADPDNLFVESDESNNAASLVVRIVEDCIAIAPDLDSCD